jgi:catechol 2,3-dioxygenase-like lactoylglutathione lyase family enzyme
VIGHLGLNVADLETARRYYGALLPVLGYEPFLDAPDQFAYKPEGDRRGAYLFFYPAVEPGDVSRHRPGLQHLAFIVPTRSAVDAALARAVELGSTVVHRPRRWSEYPPPYYAAFWTDPSGFYLEAVCHHDRD